MLLLFKDEAAVDGSHEDQPVFQHLVDNKAENSIRDEVDNKQDDKEEPHQQPQPQTQQPETEQTTSQDHTPIQIRLPLQLDFDDLAGVSFHMTSVQKECLVCYTSEKCREQNSSLKYTQLKRAVYTS
jgi:hypothetical protein